MHSELILGHSKKFLRLIEEVDRYASSAWPILLVGETGVGKDLIAQRIHARSPRSRHPFIPINCGALPGGLFESELFGYERGAFSGALQSQRGLVRAAQGGTLFLDEVGELELPLQVKLLRLLESHEIRSVGSHRIDRVDVRIIAATNRNLTEMVQQQTFRQDLLERLSVLPVEIPPLRERLEDLNAIAASLLERLGATLETDTLVPLQDYDWPGNVRQLKNLLIRAHVLGGSQIRTSLLRELIDREKNKTSASTLAESSSSRVTLADIERQVVLDRLKRCHGNRKKAAQELGIAKSTLHDKLRKWKLESPAQAWPLYREPQHPSLAQ